MIRFNKIEIEGFGSIIKPITYRLGKTGLNVIKAANGSGKSTIINALSWVLYRKMLKEKADFRPWDHVVENFPEFKGTRVKVYFKIGKDSYQIARHFKYKKKAPEINEKGNSKLILLVNGEASVLRDVRDVQAEIEGILGLSFDLFKNSVVFGQKLKRIITETGPNKKKVFDEAFETAFINRAKELTMADQNELLAELSDVKAKLRLVEEKIKRKREVLKLGESFEENKSAQLAEIKSEISELKASIKEEDDLQARYQDYEVQLKEHEEKLSLHKRYQDKLEEFKDELFRKEIQATDKESQYTAKKNAFSELSRQLAKKIANCPRCGQPLSKQKSKEEKARIQEEVKHLKVELKGLSAGMKALDEQIQKLREKEDKYNENLERAKELTREINFINQQLSSTREELQEIEYHKKSLTKLQEKKKKVASQKNKVNIGKLERSIKRLHKRYSNYQKRFNKLENRKEVNEWLIRDPLSNSGLKAYIFDALLIRLNNLLSDYHRFLGFTIRFEINMDSKRKEFISYIFKNEDIIPYQDLSGGQQQLVDIVVALSIFDIISYSKGCNVLMMDEIFESLDESNVELVSELISSKAQDKAIHLITHQKDFVAKAVQTTHLQLVNGNTEIM